MQELAIILVIALLVFGPTKLPQIGSSLGKAIRDFKRGVNGDEPGEARERNENDRVDSR